MLPLNYYPEEELKEVTKTYVKFYSKNKDENILKKINEIDNHLLERYSKEGENNVN